MWGFLFGFFFISESITISTCFSCVVYNIWSLYTVCVYHFLWDDNFDSELYEKKIVCAYLNLHLIESEWNSSLLFLVRMIVIDNLKKRESVGTDVSRHLALFWSFYFIRLMEYFMFYTLYMTSQSWGFHQTIYKSKQGGYFYKEGRSVLVITKTIHLYF